MSPKIYSAVDLLRAILVTFTDNHPKKSSNRFWGHPTCHPLEEDIAVALFNYMSNIQTNRSFLATGRRGGLAPNKHSEKTMVFVPRHRDNNILNRDNGRDNNREICNRLRNLECYGHLIMLSGNFIAQCASNTLLTVMAFRPVLVSQPDSGQQLRPVQCAQSSHL